MSIAAATLLILAGLGITAATRLSTPTAVMSTNGVDVSSHNHSQNAIINWSAVAAAGNSFTSIKVSEGTYYVNPYYASDAVQAARAGLFVMPYVFADPFSAKDNGSAREQADMAADQLRSVSVPSSQLLPLALDIEPDPYAVQQKTNRCYGLSQSDMVRWIHQFLDEAQLKTGKRPVIYTLAGWWKDCTGNSAAFGSYPLWIASYGPSAPALPAGWSKYTFWQHTAWGTTPGITGSSTDQDYIGSAPVAGQQASPVALAQLQALTSAG